MVTRERVTVAVSRLGRDDLLEFANGIPSAYWDKFSDADTDETIVEFVAFAALLNQAGAAGVSASQETREAKRPRVESSPAPSALCTASVWLTQQEKYAQPDYVCFRPGGDAIPDMPVGLFEPVVDEMTGLFAEALGGRGEPLSQQDCNVTSRMCTEMAGVFETEAAREVAFTIILQDYVGEGIGRDFPDPETSNAFTDGTIKFMTIVNGQTYSVPGCIQEVKLEIGTAGDPYFQLERFYQMYLTAKPLQKLVKYSVLPVLSVELVGPHIRVSVLVSLENNRVVCEPLTPYLHLFPMTVTQPDYMDRLARVLRAVKLTIALIKQAWTPNGGSLVSSATREASAQPATREASAQPATREASAQPTDPIRDPSLKLPYPLRPGSGFSAVELLQSETWKRVFIAEKDNREVVVKFAHLPEQAVHVHRAWAAAGLAPKLYEERRLACGWTMLVMERLRPADGWIMFRSLTPEQKQQLNHTVLEKLREAHNVDVDGGKAVHGDFRQANVMIQLQDDGTLVAPPQVRFLDFDWSDLEGKARLPAFARERLQGCGSGVKITREYDERIWHLELEGQPL